MRELARGFYVLCWLWFVGALLMLFSDHRYRTHWEHEATTVFQEQVAIMDDLRGEITEIRHLVSFAVAAICLCALHVGLMLCPAPKGEDSKGEEIGHSLFGDVLAESPPTVVIPPNTSRQFIPKPPVK